MPGKGVAGHIVDVPAGPPQGPAQAHFQGNHRSVLMVSPGDSLCVMFGGFSPEFWQHSVVESMLVIGYACFLHDKFIFSVAPVSPLPPVCRLVVLNHVNTSEINVRSC